MNPGSGEPPEATARRYFLSYRGVKLPLQLLEELPESALSNRNTWFCAYYDAQGRICGIDKLVYGEVEMRHRYEYRDDGALNLASITVGDDDPRFIHFAAG